MEPVRKELTCPGCGKTSEVRVMTSGAPQKWQCPNCKKLQTSDAAAVAASPAR